MRPTDRIIELIARNDPEISEIHNAHGYNETEVERRLAELDDDRIMELLAMHPDTKYNPRNCSIFYEAIARPAIADRIKHLVAKFDGSDYGAPAKWCRAHHDTITTWHPDGGNWDEQQQMWTWKQVAQKARVID